MNPSKPIEILEEIFSSIITVRSISVQTKALRLASARRKCRDKNFDVHLVRETPKDDLLLYEKTTDSTRLLNDKEVISESTPIYDAIEFLKDRDFLFIKEKREITRIVTKADIDSMPIRIWLFGMISLLEWHMRKYIQDNGIEWEKSLSENRLNEVKKLYNVKRECKEDVTLIECIQLIDLSTIIRKNWEKFENIFNNVTRNRLESDFFRITALRNALSHSLRLEYQWKEIYYMIDFIKNALKSM